MNRILVTGATGRVGREVVEQLLASGAKVRALTRNPEKASLPAGVDAVAGDLERPETIAAALDGVTSAFLLWTAPPATAPEVFAHLGRLAHVVYLSSPHNVDHPFFRQPNPMAAMHAELERLLAAQGARITILRPGMSRRTRGCGGGRRSRGATWCAGRSRTSRPRRSTSATSPRWRCARSSTMRTRAAITC